MFISTLFAATLSLGCFYSQVKATSTILSNSAGSPAIPVSNILSQIGWYGTTITTVTSTVTAGCSPTSTSMMSSSGQQDSSMYYTMSSSSTHTDSSTTHFDGTGTSMVISPTSDKELSSAMQSTGSEQASMSSEMYPTPTGSDSGSSMSMSMTLHSSSAPSGITTMYSESSELLTMTPMPSGGSVVMTATMMNSSMSQPDQSMTQSQSQTSMDSEIIGSTGGYTMPYYGNSTLMTTLSTKSTQSSSKIYSSTETFDGISTSDAGSGGTPTQTQNRYTPPVLAPTIDSSSLAHRVKADGKLAQAYWCALFVIVVLEISANMASLI
ncbi:hypothetical protein BZA77DRAFT_295867 [Pyronema omphalodes]|nr:hypothetical protein BZA77DRAFT_295867 [Pyronema omphalodes]